MEVIALDRRFFASTRGRIVLLLRRASRTVDELAHELNLTDNAVRAHLATLERDGLVQQQGVRRGPGKPSYSYELTPEATRLFPKAHGIMLGHLLDVLAQRLGHAELEEVLHTVGKRMAADHHIHAADLRGRLAAAVTLLNDMGGLAELEEGEETYTICGYSCPLSFAFPGRVETCRLVEAMLAELVGVPVHEHCERGRLLQCRFEVARS